MRNLRYDTSETYRQSRKTHRGQSCGYGGEVEEGMDWELGLVDVEWTDMVLLYSTWNYIQCPRVSREENQYQKQRTNCLTGHFAVEINTIL